MTAIPAPASAPTTDARWRDKKRYLWLLGLLVPLLPIMAVRDYLRWGSAWFFWIPIGVVFVVIPILDWALGTDTSNPPEWAVEQLEHDRWYRWCTYFYLPIAYAGMFVGAWFITTQHPSWAGYLGISLAVGLVAGIGINNAHELGHKRDRTERWMSKLVLAQSAYGHFYVEHNRGHHSRVATPEDPASARMGESFWRFLPRTVVGSMQSAWRLEAARMRNQGKPVWHPSNDVLNAWALTVALFTTITVIYGVAVIPFLVIQAVFGFCLLEVVNYVEHYGLLRQKVEGDRYERCRPEHSWNSNHIVSNLFLYHLERHSDHHAHPVRRYQALRHFDESPQLPNGYALMIVVAAVPPLWRRVMDHRVVEHYEGDISKANLQPAKREQLLARYA